MKLKFTKMHGAGNDFVVFNGCDQDINLTTAQFRFIADRRFGIGADQILIVEKPKKQASISVTEYSMRMAVKWNNAEMAHEPLPDMLPTSK